MLESGDYTTTIGGLTVAAILIVTIIFVVAMQYEYLMFAPASDGYTCGASDVTEDVKAKCPFFYLYGSMTTAELASAKTVK